MKAVSTRENTRDMIYIAMFAIIIAICSWISVPATVPFTLQTFGVFVTVGVLGGKRGSLSVLVYLLLGVIGVPVFAGFSGGLGVLLGSTGGYIIGLLFSALIMWGMEILITCMLFIWNSLVHVCLCTDNRTDRGNDSAWMVCISIHYPGWN